MNEVLYPLSNMLHTENIIQTENTTSPKPKPKHSPDLRQDLCFQSGYRYIQY